MHKALSLTTLLSLFAASSAIGAEYRQSDNQPSPKPTPQAPQHPAHAIIPRKVETNAPTDRSPAII